MYGAALRKILVENWCNMVKKDMVGGGWTRKWIGKLHIESRIERELLSGTFSSLIFVTRESVDETPLSSLEDGLLN